MPIQSFRDLAAWRLGMEFVLRVYGVTKTFPLEERYGLTMQLRRAAVAVPSNVSEGHRQGTKVYLRYVTIALGSLAEAETQLEVVARLELGPRAEVAAAIESAAELRRVLHGLRRALVRRLAEGRHP